MLGSVSQTQAEQQWVEYCGVTKWCQNDQLTATRCQRFEHREVMQGAAELRCGDYQAAARRGCIGHEIRVTGGHGYWSSATR